jgi:asparagine synthase (glutamine-hydrolysing)
VAAASFAPWLPAPVWKSLRRFSSRTETASNTAIHPELAALMEARRESMGVGLSKRPKDHFAARILRICQQDFGEWRKGTLGGWGIDERDPTADRRLIEFCLSLPLDMLLKEGVRRPLARAALADRLPPAILDERRKGYQAADWHEGITAHRRDIAALIERIARHEVASTIVDVSALWQMHDHWPTTGWDNPAIMARYRVALLVALSAGHFAIRASE